MVSFFLIWLLGCADARAGEVDGLTPIAVGARGLPKGLSLSAPFPEGTEFRVSCGYSPCNSYHSGVDNPNGVNDHYALDLTVNQQGNGEGHLVSAVAGAEVVFAGWGEGHWSIYGQMVVLNHGEFEGQPLFSFYAHLAEILVKKGDRVNVKQPIGRLGRSSGGKLEKLAAHVHFSVQWGASVEGGPLGGRAVLPEPMDGFRGIEIREVWVAGTGAGDAVYVTVDDLSSAFESFVPETSLRVVEDIPTEYHQYIYGTPETWSSHNGYGPRARRLEYTHGEAGHSRLVARWSPTLVVSGDYGVQIYSPPLKPGTAGTSYVVISGGTEAICTLDPKAAGGGWVDICPGKRFAGGAGSPITVELRTSEALPSGAKLPVDAVRFARR